jgi:hypothetical protein
LGEEPPVMHSSEMPYRGFSAMLSFFAEAIKAAN